MKNKNSKNNNILLKNYKTFYSIFFSIKNFRKYIKIIIFIAQYVN